MTGVSIILSLGNYLNDSDDKKYDKKLKALRDLQSLIWGPKNMNYKVMSNESTYLSLNSLLDFIKESRCNITNDGSIEYLVINIIGKGNNKYLTTSDNQQISWLKIYELFSFANTFFVPTVFCIDVLNENDDTFQSDDADYEGLNVFGYTANEIDYLGFITNALYQRKDACYLTDVIEHIMIWNKYIFTVPKEIDWDEDDDQNHEYKQRESNDENDNHNAMEVLSIFDQKKKRANATERGGNDWSITYSIDRRAWGPFLSKYDYCVFVHDEHKNAKDVKSVMLQIERPIGVKKESKFKKILQNGSFINETIREEGRNAVGNTSLSVKIVTHSNQIVITPTLSLN
eukprot:427873_1